jgi:hypothetical protein
MPIGAHTSLYLRQPIKRYFFIEALLFNYVDEFFLGASIYNFALFYLYRKTGFIIQNQNNSHSRIAPYFKSKF